MKFFRLVKITQLAFREFIGQSQRTILWQEDFDYLNMEEAPVNLLVQHSDNPLIELIKLKGKFNRFDAWLAIQAVHKLTKKTHMAGELLQIINKFCACSAAWKRLCPGYTAITLTRPKRFAAQWVWRWKWLADKNQTLVVVYEPLTNRRQQLHDRWLRKDLLCRC